MALISLLTIIVIILLIIYFLLMFFFLVCLLRVVFHQTTANYIMALNYLLCLHCLDLSFQFHAVFILVWLPACACGLRVGWH